MMKTRRVTLSLTLWAILLALWTSSSSTPLLQVEAALRGVRSDATTTTRTLSLSAKPSQRQRLAMEDKNEEKNNQNGPAKVEDTLIPTNQPSGAPSVQAFMTLPPGEPGTVNNPIGGQQQQGNNQGDNGNSVGRNSFELLPFSLTVVGSLNREEPVLRNDLEEYLAAEMSASLDQSVSILLDFGERRNRHLRDDNRDLQQTATRLQYVGTVTFVNEDGTPISDPTTNAFGVSELPTKAQVDVTQIVALEDTGLLQQYLDATSTASTSTGSETNKPNDENDDSVTVLAIVVDDRFPVPGPVQQNGSDASQNERSPSQPTKGSGGDKDSTIVAVIAAVCVLVLFVICFLVYRHYHSKPPPPPPLECEIIPDISEVDGDNANGGGGAKVDPNMEMVLKEHL